ncbi:DUF2254 family protein [Streptomyces sp. NBC_00233]|uniref:DUF2254 family protein n=1 Tax=Streptomyces sp. NBC_00233 TaxID=2975686 RepID=UPI00224DABB3|nr:DUF2254 family protein [Streptomyces sp. NBC_00233]MCX5230794.1 DUF2254 domain-containing protein [Streptomyces sp. NBC_00233]
MSEPPLTTVGTGHSAERVVRPRRALRAGITHAVAVGVAVVLGILLPAIDGGSRVAADRVVAVLNVLGVGVLSVTALIFSLMFLVVQWAAGNFSHRLALFRSDPLVWRVFAFVIGVLVYSVTAVLAIGSRDTVSVAVPIAALVMAAVAFVLVRRLQLVALRSIQLSHVLDELRDRGLHVLDVYCPPGEAAGARDSMPGAVRLPGTVTASVLWRGTSVLVEQFNLVPLVAAAQRAGATVVLRAKVGDVLYDGDAVADVHHGTVPEAEVLKAVVAGPERTFHQDPALAFRLLSDIGLRALSPAINDPATAVQALDAVEDLLRHAAAGPIGQETRAIADASGTVRVILPVPGWDVLLRVGLDDILVIAPAMPMVLTRCRRLLTGVLSVAPAPLRPPLEERLAWTEQQLTTRPSFMRDEAG